MSLRAIPLLVFSFILYNLVVFTMGSDALTAPLFSATLLSGGVWSFTWGDLILLATLVCCSPRS